MAEKPQSQERDEIKNKMNSIKTKKIYEEVMEAKEREQKVLIGLIMLPPKRGKAKKMIFNEFIKILTISTP
ncbi:hypothetical protein FRX31_034165 [Thalictrum thalictroides]|uniref:Uncharacterized protein n=1 Tax=Thalictrum thalictroides TaxID=46969 RepID=A0A7J6UUJ5_THATH|nr:hypothetical protein FRX31_034165 [Thalictrum thalictroides]